MNSATEPAAVLPTWHPSLRPTRCGHAYLHGSRSEIRQLLPFVRGFAEEANFLIENDRAIYDLPGETTTLQLLARLGGELLIVGGGRAAVEQTEAFAAVSRAFRGEVFWIDDFIDDAVVIETALAGRSMPIHPAVPRGPNAHNEHGTGVLANLSSPDQPCRVHAAEVVPRIDDVTRAAARRACMKAGFVSVKS